MHFITFVDPHLEFFCGSRHSPSNNPLDQTARGQQNGIGEPAEPSRSNHQAAAGAVGLNLRLDGTWRQAPFKRENRFRHSDLQWEHRLAGITIGGAGHLIRADNLHQGKDRLCR